MVEIHPSGCAIIFLWFVFAMVCQTLQAAENTEENAPVEEGNTEQEVA